MLEYLMDGWILKWHEPKLGWKEFAVPSSIRKRELHDGSTDPNLEPIYGRLLGLDFNLVTCDLYIGDAYFSLLMIGPNGGIAQTIVSSIEGISFKFINRSLKAKLKLVRAEQKLVRAEQKLVRAEQKLIRAHPPNYAKQKVKHESSQKMLNPDLLSGLKTTVSDTTGKSGCYSVGRLGEIDDDVPDPIGIKYDQEGRILKQLDGNGEDVFSSISEINESLANDLDRPLFPSSDASSRASLSLFLVIHEVLMVSSLNLLLNQKHHFFFWSSFSSLLSKLHNGILASIVKIA
ncbi:hypothetical protein Gotri_022039 [Gossypium trilobum]|uniref:Uncharacterized protein n=1 Tax=Gossypium trilobum TaxID=34281 RepID=A0A7J9DEE8_9ROSI|nr:hypothetical protein [Gossypium trilobum]